MPRKALASLNVVINAVTSPLFRGLALASKRLIKFGAKMRAVGRSISTSFTMPFAMIGAAGAKMAIDFEQSMTKITTLVGTSAEEVNKLGAEVKAMAVETATPAKELADALFFIQSAGVKGSASMDALKVSAKGAAMQMGDITDIASATTSIMTAYGHSSQKSGDLLHETLKQGKFDAAEFMSKIGQVIPTAASFGISFEEMGAAVATMSKISGDAAGSLTAVNQVMLKLMTPGEQQKQILADINMSYSDLNTMMKDSMLGTLEHLFHKLEGNDEMLAKVFGGARAVKGAFATAGLQAETYAEVLDGMNNSMGNIEKGFQTQAQTVGFKMKQSFEKLKLAGMELGSTLLPVFTAIIGFAVKLGKAFTELDSGTKKLVVGAAALFAFSGPLMELGGGLISIFGMLLSPIGLTVIALGALFAVIYNNWESARKIFVDFINYWIDLYNESKAFRAIVEGFKFTFNVLWETVKWFFKASWQALKNFGKFFGDIFGGIGDMIKGVFTRDTDLIGDGFDRMMEAGSKTLSEGMEQIDSDYQQALINTAMNAQKALEGKTKIEFITEEDVQGNVDNISGWLTDKLGAVKNKIKGFMGGSTLLVPENEEEAAEKTGTIIEGAIDEQKKTWEEYWRFIEDGWDKLEGKIAETWSEISKIAAIGLNAVAGLWDAQQTKEQTILDNDKTRAQEKFDNEYEKREEAIQNSLMSEKQKDAALLALKGEFDGRQESMDKEFNKKQKALKKKAGEQSKKLKIADALMATGQAIVNTLGAVPFPFNIPAAAAVGVMGMMQVAAIRSTPIPLAEGGLAFGPTQAIVGDNPGAANDPEVIAPLSKLKGMMGGGGAAKVTLDVAGIVKGTDIWLSNTETETKRERYI